MLSHCLANRAYFFVSVANKYLLKLSNKSGESTTLNRILYQLAQSCSCVTRCEWLCVHWDWLQEQSLQVFGPTSLLLKTEKNLLCKRKTAWKCAAVIWAWIRTYSEDHQVEWEVSMWAFPLASLGLRLEWIYWCEALFSSQPDCWRLYILGPACMRDAGTWGVSLNCMQLQLCTCICLWTAELIISN